MASHAADVRAASAVVDRAGSSFYWAMRLLPRPRREAMYAVYAFCRTVDDIADGPDGPEQKRMGLARWRVEVEAVFSGRPHHAVGRALVAPIARYGLRREDFLAVIDGMEMDAAGAMVAPDWPTLERYCGCVAGAVGRLAVRIFGVPEAEGPPLARALGLAVQLTNILRDLREDARDGRLYLPREALDRHGVPPGPPSAAVVHPAIGRVAADVAGTARRRFAEAEDVMDRIPRSAARPARVMAAIYRRLLDRVEGQGVGSVARARLGAIEKLWIALRHSWR
ncbi:MAG: presqualene diphosphate synthase HpnD [Alphaproteobacteria bacterium]